MSKSKTAIDAENQEAKEASQGAETAAPVVTAAPAVAAKPADKQAVSYLVNQHTFIVVGERAVVVPVDHPDEYNVTNGAAVLTTTVESYDAKTGVFETKNSVYKPVKKVVQS